MTSYEFPCEECRAHLLVQLPPIQPLSQTRWAQINKTTKQVIKNWAALEAAAEFELRETRASQVLVRNALTSPTLRTEVNILFEFSRKMLQHLEWFESQEPRAHEVYSRLQAVSASFMPLFRVEELEAILLNGHCPPEHQESMKLLARAVANAGLTIWEKKVSANQAEETLDFYKALMAFDPEQKNGEVLTEAHLLKYCRPISDSIERWDDADGPHPLIVRIPLIPLR
jgi:hypothetical protein